MISRGTRRALRHNGELENRKLALVLLALLCLAAYAPALSLPLFEDDYPLITMSDGYGFSGALSVAIFRPRATTGWICAALWRTVHFAPAVYHLVSLTLHT